MLQSEALQGAEFAALMQVPGGARRALLALGDERIELLQFDRPGEPYPTDRHASDLIFQHFAIVVADMDRAYERLRSVPCWSPISEGGPVTLPASSGGVSAFKFRDPEGHPLELLAFPRSTGPRTWRARAQDTRRHDGFLGIDHSAIVVADTARSVTFYQGLGLMLSAHTHNTGIEQARLDGLEAPDVEVTALELPAAGPHLELLCYQELPPVSGNLPRNHDVAATRLVLESTGTAPDGRTARAVRDPDGHWLVLWRASSPIRMDSGAGSSGS